MEPKDHKNLNVKKNKRKKYVLIFIVILTLGLISVPLLNLNSDKQPKQVIDKSELANDDIIDGIHVRTGLIDDEGLMTVIANCTACHSAQLITQNRMNKERWDATIRWMQETQNLWDLGENQEVIVNYLVKNYPVYSKGRRENLSQIEWYDLTD